MRGKGYFKIIFVDLRKFGFVVTPQLLFVLEVLLRNLADQSAVVGLSSELQENGVHFPDSSINDEVVLRVPRDFLHHLVEPNGVHEEAFVKPFHRILGQSHFGKPIKVVMYMQELVHPTLFYRFPSEPGGLCGMAWRPLLEYSCT